MVYVQDALGSWYYGREAVSRDWLITARLVMIEVARADSFAKIIRLDLPFAHGEGLSPPGSIGTTAAGHATTTNARRIYGMI
jgi:hypothetical protein